MSLKTVCWLCLTTDKPFHVISDSPLQYIYEKLTNIPLNALRRPVTACYICYYQLRKCHNLMVRSVRAEKVLSRILQGSKVKGDSDAVLNGKSLQRALRITPTEIITVTVAGYNLMDGEIKQEPLLPQCNGEIEIVRLRTEHLKSDESEDEGSADRELIEDVDIEKHGLTDVGRDMKLNETDPLNISIPIENIETNEIIDGVIMKSMVAENFKEKESEGAAPAEKCKKTNADKTQGSRRCIPTSERKKILKKPRTRGTVVKESTGTNVATYTLRSTKKNTRQISQNTSMRSVTKLNKSHTSIKNDDKYGNTNTDVANSKQSKMFVTNDCNSFDEKYQLELQNVVKKERKNTSLLQHTELYKPKFNSTGTVIRYTEIHSGKNVFLCEICPRSFSNKSNLNKHIRTHTGEKPFECEVCKARFGRKSSLKTHIVTHTGEKPFQCPICMARFSHKQYLKMHTMMHTGEKPFQCVICEERFKHKGHLSRHFRLHTGEKPFQCEICKFRFSHRNNLKTHLLTHTGEKPFECGICDVRFRQKCDLKRHFRTHTGEKPYQCDICRWRFAQKQHLRGHMRKHTV